jgi:hypothetical protein
MQRGDIKKEVYKYLDSIKYSGYLSGWAIRSIIVERTNYSVYPTVVLKLCKEWAYLSGGTFDCVDYRNSLYRVSPGIKITGTRLEKEPVGSHVKLYKAMRGFGIKNS